MVIRGQHPWYWGLCGALLLAGPALALRLTPAPMVQRPALSVPRLVVPPDRSLDQPVRFSGRVTNGLYASLRAAGMGIYPAQQSVKALGAHIDFAADMMADTRFDVVLGNGGQPEAAVLYIGVSQPGRRIQGRARVGQALSAPCQRRIYPQALAFAGILCWAIHAFTKGWIMPLHGARPFMQWPMALFRRRVGLAAMAKWCGCPMRTKLRQAMPI